MNNGVIVYFKRAGHLPSHSGKLRVLLVHSPNKYKIDSDEELSGTRIEENTIVIKQLNACVFASLNASILMLTNIL